MTHVLGEIWRFRTHQFTVIVDAIEEDCPDLSWDDSGEVTTRIEAGDYLLFCARARVIHETLGEIASDYLGNCIYESLEQFRDHIEAARATRARKMKDGACIGSYFADMVDNVCREARGVVLNAQQIRMRDRVYP